MLRGVGGLGFPFTPLKINKDGLMCIFNNKTKKIDWHHSNECVGAFIGVTDRGFATASRVGATSEWICFAKDFPKGPYMSFEHMESELIKHLNAHNLG